MFHLAILGSCTRNAKKCTTALLAILDDEQGVSLNRYINALL